MAKTETEPPYAGPWVELHLHLEGAAPPALIRDLARANDVAVEGVFGPDGGYAFGDFAEFLKVYEVATAAIRGPRDYARLADAVLDAQEPQGVIYTEAALCPAFCGGGDLAAWQDNVAANAEVAAAREGAGGPRLRLIATAVRHFGPDQARIAARCAAETAGPMVVGFGMGGQERFGRAKDFAYAFDMAREAELGLTVHAGEFGGPDSVAAALADLRVARIGHGVRAIEDPALVDRLAEAGTVLEVCPGGNVRLGLYPDIARHPVERLRAAGVPVTLSTDDPTFFDTALSTDAAALATAFDWAAPRFAEVNRVAAEAAFCDADTRAALRAALAPDTDPQSGPAP